MTGAGAVEGGDVGDAATGEVDDVGESSAGAGVGVVVKAGILTASDRPGPAGAVVGREKATLSAKRACSSRVTRSTGAVAAVAVGGRSGSPGAGLLGLLPVLGVTASLV